MPHRSAGTITASPLKQTLTLAAIVIASLMGASRVGAQSSPAQRERACQDAGYLITRAAGIHYAARAAEMKEESWERERHDETDGQSMLLARLLGCGPSGGIVAGTIIRALRMETREARLSAFVDPFTNFRDTAVYGAFSDVARDRSASEPARVRAFLGLYTLRTGKYWLTAGRLHGTIDPDLKRPTAACLSGLEVTDAVPFWYEGAPLPSTYERDIHRFAQQVWRDSTQSLQVRAAAYCAAQD